MEAHLENLANIADNIVDLTTSHRTVSISNLRIPELADSIDKIHEGLRKLEVRMAQIKRWQNKKAHHSSPPCSFHKKPRKSLSRQPEVTV